MKEEKKIKLVEKILKSEILFKKYKNPLINKILRISKVYSCCPNSTCKFIYFRDEHENNRFDCQLCNMSFCLRCRVEFHEGLSC
jgi:hypothetical protein